MPHDLAQTVFAAFQLSDIEIKAWALAWARVVPALVLVPAFGLAALPVPARVTLGLALSASAVAGLKPVSEVHRAFPFELVVQAARGLPVALSAALLLWAASMAGSLVDNLRGDREPSGLPHVEGGSTKSGALMSMLAAIAFLQSGGPGRVAAALGRPELEFHEPLLRVVTNIAASIELAVAVAAPVVAASVVVQVASALFARSASPAAVGSLLLPLRSVVLLTVFALTFERMVSLLTLLVATPP